MRSIITRGISTLLVFAPATMLGQAKPQRRSVTLGQAVAAALQANLDILLSRSSEDSARSERAISSALPNPNIGGIPNTPYQYAVSIPLDVMPGRVYRTRAAGIGVHASESDRDDMARQVRFAVSRAFADVLLAQEKRELTTARRAIVLQLLVADSARYRIGDVPVQNLVRSEVELARADAQLARANVDLETDGSLLQALMGINERDSTLSVSGSLTYLALVAPDEATLASASMRRSDLAAAEDRVEQSLVLQKAATALLLPTPIFSFVRQYTAPFENGHFYSLGISFDLPVLNWRSGERARAAVAAKTAQLARRRTEIALHRDVSTALAEFRIQRALVERYQSGLLQRVDESALAVRYAYGRGASSLLDVLDAVRAQQDVHTDYITALHDYWLSVYALNAAVGSDVLGMNR